MRNCPLKVCTATLYIILKNCPLKVCNAILICLNIVLINLYTKVLLNILARLVKTTNVGNSKIEALGPDVQNYHSAMEKFDLHENSLG